MGALIGFGCVLSAALGFSRRWSPTAGRLDRLLATAILLPTVGVIAARLAGGLGLLTPAALLGGLAGVAAIAWIQAPRAAPRSTAPEALGPAAALPLAVAGLGVALALVAARGLPIWQWDSLGYHLPFVANALQAGSLDGVPWQTPYLGSYPHAIELWDLGARTLLGSDRWLDAAQFPLALIFPAATVGLARRAGATLELSLGLGSLALVLPAVFLQIPTAYVDVPAAGFLLAGIYWALATPSLEAAVLTGLAFGLAVGSKPTAPAAVALLCLGFAARCGQRGRWGLPFLSAAIILAVGAESYAMNLVRHGNPLWPLALNLGPLHFPGPHSMAEILGSGAAAPHLTGPLPWRVLRSWSTLDPLPVFDMRVGGFGPLFLFVALPLGMLGAARRGGYWLLALLAGLATADPAIARYTLSFPALCLALSAAELARLAPRWRLAGLGLAAVLAALGLGLAVPGLTGGAGSLHAVLDRPWSEREAILLPTVSAASWAAWRSTQQPGDRVATDDSFDLSYLLWRSDFTTRVERLPPRLEGAGLADWLRTHDIRTVVAVDDGPVGRLSEQRPDRLQRRFACGASDPHCVVYSFER